MKDMFKIKGRLCDASGVAAEGLFVALVDEDLLTRDDLIAVGKAGVDGGFQVAFMGSEIRQDAFEVERTPDLRIVASAVFDGALEVVFTKAYGDLDWSAGAVDLGVVTMEGVELSRLVPLDGFKPLPGYNRGTARLEIDEAMVRWCLAEVAPIVEHLTGWGELLEGLKVEVVESLAPIILREAFLQEGMDPKSFEARLAGFLLDYAQGAGAACAIYDPHGHAVVIQKGIMKQTSLEGLKVVCGHELVHVGQYKYTPGLKAYTLHRMRRLFASASEGGAGEGLDETSDSFMVEVEGYARYIETDFLIKNYYPMAVMTYHASFFERVMRALMAAAFSEVGEARALKQSQYVDGREVYRGRAGGSDPQAGGSSQEAGVSGQQAGGSDQPARFTLDVSSLPGGAAFVEGEGV